MTTPDDDAVPDSREIVDLFSECQTIEGPWGSGVLTVPYIPLSDACQVVRERDAALRAKLAERDRLLARELQYLELTILSRDRANYDQNDNVRQRAKEIRAALEGGPR